MCGESGVSGHDGVGGGASGGEQQQRSDDGVGGDGDVEPLPLHSGHVPLLLPRIPHQHWQPLLP